MSNYSSMPEHTRVRPELVVFYPSMNQ